MIYDPHVNMTIKSSFGTISYVRHVGKEEDPFLTIEWTSDAINSIMRLSETIFLEKVQ